MVGLSLAEGSGFLSIFLLSKDDADIYSTAALAILLLHAPVFANKIESDSAK